MSHDKVSILIKKSALVIEKLSNHALAPYDLTHTQYKILRMLYHNADRPIRQADIESHFSMTNPTVTGILQNLEKKGLVQRVQNPDDRRSKLLKLTDAAFALEPQLRALGDSMEKKMTENLTEEESQQLAELLKKMLGK